MARKNVGLRYGEFEFPSEQGFTGSAGRTEVKGYMRGGHVKKGGKRNTPNKASKRAKGTTKAAHGGFMGPEREITVDDVTISTPRKHGGRVSMHDKLKSEGKKLGYAYGGRVKYGAGGNTSGEFKMKKGKMDSMDHGVQPARRGQNARNQAEAEAGGTGRLKPGLKKGGSVKKRGAGKKAAKGALEVAMAVTPVGRLGKILKPGVGKAARKAGKAAAKAARKASAKGMPKNVKSRGGVVGKAGAAR